MNFSAILAVLRKVVRSGCKRRKDRFQRDYGTRVSRCSTSWKRGSKTKHLGQEEFDVLRFV